MSLHPELLHNALTASHSFWLCDLVTHVQITPLHKALVTVSDRKYMQHAVQPFSFLKQTFSLSFFFLEENTKQNRKSWFLLYLSQSNSCWWRTNSVIFHVTIVIRRDALCSSSALFFKGAQAFHCIKAAQWDFLR